jgi:hypothetical protein
MADEYDRKLIPSFVESAFTMSLGMAYTSLKVIANPQDSATKIMGEVQGLFAIPDDTPADMQSKAQAIAGNFMEKGTTWMQEFQKAGDQFTASDKKE